MSQRSFGLCFFIFSFFCVLVCRLAPAFMINDFTGAAVNLTVNVNNPTNRSNLTDSLLAPDLGPEAETTLSYGSGGPLMARINTTTLGALRITGNGVSQFEQIYDLVSDTDTPAGTFSYNPGTATGFGSGIRFNWLPGNTATISLQVTAYNGNTPFFSALTPVSGATPTDILFSSMVGFVPTAVTALGFKLFVTTTTGANPTILLLNSVETLSAVPEPQLAVLVPVGLAFGTAFYRRLRRKRPSK